MTTPALRIAGLSIVMLVAASRAGSSAPTVTVTIDPNQVAQTIDGFGVAQPRSGPGLAGDDTPGDAAQLVYQHPQRAALMDMTFSALNGIGATVLRMKITSALAPAPGQWSTTDTAQVWIMKEAAARGPVKLLGTAWSPPPWMKTNGSVFAGRCSNDILKSCVRDVDPDPSPPPAGDGDSGCSAGGTCLIGTLSFDHYQSFADYLVHYVRDYANANGIKIYAVSMANEPEVHVLWDGCAWYGDWIATFLDLYLRPAFAADPSITTKVVVPEAALWNHVAAQRPLDPLHTGPGFDDECPPERPGDPCHPLAPTSLLGPTMTTPGALARVDIVAGHRYGHELTFPLPNALTSGNRVWMTETSGLGTLYMDTSLGFAERIHTSLTGLAQVSAWLYFIYVGPGDGSLVTTDGTNLVANRLFWVLGNYSKYVRPGYVRLGSSSNDSKVLATAFQDPAIGQRVVVVINKDAIARTVQINGLGGVTATPYVTTATWNLAPQPDVSLASAMTVPAQSIVTYVASPPRLTSDILWRSASTGKTAVWLSSIAATASYPGALGSDWQVMTAGYFDGNRRADILWRNANGSNVIWHDGTNASTTVLAARDNNWRFQGVGLFDLDNRSDIVWRCLPPAPATMCGGAPAGTIEIWYDGNASDVRTIWADLAYTVQGIGDFNANGFSDILWRSTAGQLVIWNEGWLNPTWPGVLDHNWRLEGIGDFDGNFRDDIVWRCMPIAPATSCGSANAGLVAIWHDGTNTTTWHGTSPVNSLVRGIGDFDGDGRADILWRSMNGTPLIWLNASAVSLMIPDNPGVDWDVAGIGRFDL